MANWPSGAALKARETIQPAWSYKPLCLLDDISKLLEQLLLQHLKEALQADGGLHPNQISFRKERSNTDTVKSIVGELQTGLAISGMALVVSIDIRNVFNSVEWGDILFALETRHLLLIANDGANLLQRTHHQVPLEWKSNNIRCQQGCAPGSSFGSMTVEHSIWPYPLNTDTTSRP